MSEVRTEIPPSPGQEQPFGSQGRAPAVEMDNVSKNYDGGMITALTGLSLRIEQGESVAVTGPSGCGKSTMLHLIAALDRPTSGAIRVGGADLASQKDLPGYRRRHIGLVFQLHNLLPQLSAIQNVEVAMFGTGLTRGQRRDRALANEPELLLADEPTGSLDERSVDLVLDLFSRLRAERPGMTMIIVTHDIRVAGTADRIIWLRDGRVDRAHGAIGSR
jgi:putative ABC transport system ATP-binding protein